MYIWTFDKNLSRCAIWKPCLVSLSCFIISSKHNGFLFSRCVRWARDDNCEWIILIIFCLELNIRKHYQIWPCVHITKIKFNSKKWYLYLELRSKFVGVWNMKPSLVYFLCFHYFAETYWFFVLTLRSEQEIRRVNCMDHILYFLSEDYP